MNSRDALFAFFGFNLALLVALLFWVFKLSEPSDNHYKMRIAEMQKQLDSAMRQEAERKAASDRARAAEEAAKRAGDLAMQKALAEARAKAEADMKKQAEAAHRQAVAHAAAAEKAAAEARARAENLSRGTTGDQLFEQGAALEAEGRGAEAVRTYTRAARSGSGKAAKRLGEIYDKGIPGVPRDYAESLKWYNTARALGEDIRDDRRNRADADRARAEAKIQAEAAAAQARVAAAEKAAAERIAAAEVAAADAARRQRDSVATGPTPGLVGQAAQLEMEGKGQEAVRIYTQAVRSGSGPAARRLWEIYDKGIPGVPRDYAEALKWLYTARALGEDIKDIRRENSPAMQEILRRSAAEDFHVQAVMLEKEGRFADAARYYRLAARTGDGKAANRLGEIYGKGLPGVDPNYAESLKWCYTARALGEEPNCAAR